MVNVEIGEEIITNHKQYIRDSIIGDRIKKLKSEKMLSVLSQTFDKADVEEHKNFCDFLLEQFLRMKKEECVPLFMGNVSELEQIIEEINGRFPVICNLIESESKIKYEDKTAQYWQIIYWALGYDVFSQQDISCAQNETVNIYNFDKLSLKKWGAYAYVLSLGLKVCPYCNRNFITPIYSENGKVRADLDHFFPKHKYPYLSISLYNLVPSCKLCNSSLKGKKEFTYSENFHPFDNIDVDKLYKFTYLPKNVRGFIDADEFDVGILYDERDDHWEKIRNNNDMFCIEELYQYHKDVICKLLKKRLIYSDEYIEYLYRCHSNLFRDENEVRELLLSQFDSRDISNTPLGKMSSDIIKELDF